MRKSDRLRARLIVIEEATSFLESKDKSMGRGSAPDNMNRLESEAARYMSENGGRFSDERSARLIAHAALGAFIVEWTKELVRERLKEAARGIDKIVGRVGPSVKGGFWPESALFADLTDADRNIIYQAELDGTRAPSSSGAAGGDRDVSRMEQSVYWPALYLSADGHAEARMALQCWCWCEARRQPFSDFYKSLGCSRRTANRRIDDALAAILAGLIRDGVEP